MTALERIEESGGPRSSWLISVNGTERDPDADPFRPGFLSALEMRTEILALLRRLDERSRRLLLLWFVYGRPVLEIATELRVSRVHCYRLRNQALDEMLRACDERREAARAS